MQSSGVISTTYTVENESKWATDLIQTLGNKPANCSCHGRLMNGQINEIGWPQAYLPLIFVKVGRTFADKSIYKTSDLTTNKLICENEAATRVGT